MTVGHPIELAKSVYRVPTMPFSSINSYVFVEPTGDVTLVDAGMKWAARSIIQALKRLGKQADDVTRIILTHAHLDHAGDAAHMQKVSGARVLCHGIEAPYAARGRQPPVDEHNFGARIYGNLPVGFKKIRVDEQLQDGQLLDIAGGLRVVHTPGHTPGHISLLHEPSGVLITGDAVFNVRAVWYPMPWFCSDVAMAHDTADRLCELDYETAAFMHGREIRGDAPKKIREMLRNRRRN
jgi:glyoxylase-like metal-dependent hydrolase (beta-lactamase superfamily II)